MSSAPLPMRDREPKTPRPRKRHRCAGRCGRKTVIRGTLCGACTSRLPQDIASALLDVDDQPWAERDARRWIRKHPESR